MHFSSFVGLAAALAGVTAAQKVLPPQPDFQYDETADWYRDHGMPVPEVSSQITTIEANRSYVVKLECPDCPFLVKNGREVSWQERDNALLLKFDIKDAESAMYSPMHLNGAAILPLGAMPLYISAFQVAGNTSQSALDSIIRSGMLDPDFAWQTSFHAFGLRYEHALLKTKTPGQWYLQFDVQGLQHGADGQPKVFDADRRIVQMLVQEEKKGANEQGREDRSLLIRDIGLVERYQRVQPLKMKCGKLAMVKTLFDPAQWDEYGQVDTLSHFWNMVFATIGGHWADLVQHNALLLPLALLCAFVVFFARAWYQRRQRDAGVDAEYALLEETSEDLPPAYADIPVIKVEEYD